MAPPAKPEKLPKYLLTNKLLPNRQERRAGSQRERARVVKSQADKLYDLVGQGASERAIASTLGYTLQDTRGLLALVEEGRVVDRASEAPGGEGSS